MAKITEFMSDLAPQQVRKFAHDEFPDASVEDYQALGLSIAEDADVDGVLEQTGFTPLQYLQYPLNKPIEVLTTPCLIDKIAGRMTGTIDWEMENVIQPAIENTGVPRLYGDDADVPFASFNTDFELRTIQRFELGCRVGRLEDARFAKMGALGFKSPHDTKRASIAKAFQLLQDEIGFRGMINGSGVTEGLFTDHNLLGAETLPNGGTWLTTSNTYEKICADIRFLFGTLNSQTDTHFDGMAGDKCQLVLPPLYKNALTTANSLGKTVLEWLKENYPGCEVVAAPRAKNANGAAGGVIMLIADELGGNEVIKQIVPTVMRLLGVEQRMKHVAEDYTFATAGVIVKQPLGIVRAAVA